MLTPSGIAQGYTVEAIRVFSGEKLFVNDAQTRYAGTDLILPRLDITKESVAHGNVYDQQLERPVLLEHRTACHRHPIPRLYHSVAPLLPTGEISIAGSAVKANVSNFTYITDHHAEILKPDYVHDLARPTIIDSPAQIDVHDTHELSHASFALMEFGFSTHSVHTDPRHVERGALNLPETSTLEVSSPSNMFSPGLSWLSVNGILCAATPAMIGNGEGPPGMRRTTQN
ncbi:hypothetical protein BKA62DRAFT_667831 [Auriculariales sp. MPI-PUGE-AT-0066]|nr:hypothetical protein BKA62DRAFT_667831 [Auriculariales sp. MPI-PUGE-AT-0066]